MAIVCLEQKETKVAGEESRTTEGRRENNRPEMKRGKAGRATEEGRESRGTPKRTYKSSQAC